MLSLFHLHWGTYSVHVVVQVWKCQCVSVSVEVSVFKGFSGRTLRNAFGKKQKQKEKQKAKANAKAKSKQLKQKQKSKAKAVEKNQKKTIKKENH